jgi:transposase
MDVKIITTFYIIDEFFKKISYKDHPKARVTNSEVATLMITAAYYFGGNFEKTRLMFLCRNYCKSISKSRLNRRIHAIPSVIWNKLLSIFRNLEEKIFIVDSFPVPVIKQARVSRAHMYKGKEYKGYCAAKKEYFYGLKVHMIVDQTGIPIEFYISPGSMHDIKAIKHLTINLQKDSILIADAGYTDYAFEEELRTDRQITLGAKRRKNSKKPSLLQDESFYKKRKRIETTFSSILRFTSRTIQAVTQKCFELKLSLFIFAYCFLNF